jgi:hypothetical protein
MHEAFLQRHTIKKPAFSIGPFLFLLFPLQKKTVVLFKSYMNVVVVARGRKKLKQFQGRIHNKISNLRTINIEKKSILNKCDLKTKQTQNK